MRLEQVLHGQREQRAQAFDDLLSGHAFDEPAGVDLRPFAEVGERVAGEDCTMTRDPEDEVVALVSGEGFDADGQPITGRVPMRLAFAVDQPPQVVADPAFRRR